LRTPGGQNPQILQPVEKFPQPGKARDQAAIAIGGGVIYRA